MRIHPKGLMVLALFAALLMLGVSLRWGIAAIVAVTVIDIRSFAGLFGSGRYHSEKR